MIGNNQIHLNQATICKAVEEYLNKRLSPSHAVEVTKVDFFELDNAVESQAVFRAFIKGEDHDG